MTNANRNFYSSGKCFQAATAGKHLEFVKIFFLLFFCLFSAATFNAQEKCDLTLQDAPIVFDLSLEMTPQQTQSVFGKNLKIKVKKEGSFFQNFIDKRPPAFLAKVRALYLRFFNRKLYQTEIFYESEEGKENLDEFVADLSVKLKLPTKYWKRENGKYLMDCAEFSLVADNVLNPRIELTDKAVKAEFEESQKRKNK